MLFGARVVHNAIVLEDYDFHPYEATVRVFRIPDAGILRLGDEVAIYWS